MPTTPTTPTTRWTDEEFADELISRSYFCEIQQALVIPVSTVIELAFDQRVPDGKAEQLQKMARHWQQTGNPLMNL